MSLIIHTIPRIKKNPHVLSNMQPRYVCVEVHIAVLFGITTQYVQFTNWYNSKLLKWTFVTVMIKTFNVQIYGELVIKKLTLNYTHPQTYLENCLLEELLEKLSFCWWKREDGRGEGRRGKLNTIWITRS